MGHPAKGRRAQQLCGRGSAIREARWPQIFLSSARPGLGGGDIWFATRDSIKDPWSTPQLAAGINTAAAENVPALSWDGRTLYFSSNRSGAQGEIYFATRHKVTGNP